MEAFSTLLALCAGNSPVPGEFPAQRPVTRSFDIFFDLCLNKRLSKQSWGWWFETLSRPLWRQGNGSMRRPCVIFQWIHYSELLSENIQLVSLTTLSDHGDAFDTWWRHDKETLFVLQDLCEGNPPITGRLPHNVTIIADLMFYLLFVWITCWINSCVPGDWWSRCHCNDTVNDHRRTVL